MAHDAAGEAGPRAVGARLHGDLADAERVDPGAEDREDRRQERERRGHRQPDDDRPGDAHRAQDHELEQDEAQEAEQHGEAGEEHGPAGGRDGDPDGLRHAVRPLAVRQLLAEAAGHQQRVVHAQAEAQERGQVEHEDAHRDHGGHDEDPGQRDQHRRAAHGERHARGDEAAEHEQQGEGRQRQRDQLAAPEVGLGDRLDVAVERRAAGDLDAQAGDLAQGRLDGRDRVGRVVRRQVEEDDVVRGVAVRADLARGEDVGQDPGHVRGARRRPRGRLRSRRPATPGCPAVSVSERVDEDEGRRLQRRAPPGAPASRGRTRGRRG